MASDSNRELMLRGEPYLAADPQLEAERRRARRLTDRLNAASVDDGVQIASILHELLGCLGEDAYVRPPFHCDYGSNIAIGARTFVNFGAIVLDCAPVTIGEDVQIATAVQLLTATHPLEQGARRAGWESAHPIAIGDGAWLGGGVIVCPGVSVGAGAVVGAGSVVTRDVPAGHLAYGNPCRVVRDLRDG
jgi:maltose O-acetyltransferase